MYCWLCLRMCSAETDEADDSWASFFGFGDDAKASKHQCKFFPMWMGLPDGGVCRGCSEKTMRKYCRACFLCDRCAAAAGPCELPAEAPKSSHHSGAAMGGRNETGNSATESLSELDWLLLLAGAELQVKTILHTLKNILHMSCRELLK